ncbi:MAG TPA: hypothetical protein DC049_07965 [Spirochaetia bacterium]|nr:hypothetical protein [Spirochaetia bacterium]
MKKHIIITFAILAVVIGLFSAIASIQHKDAVFPAMTEKDISLIEAFIREMNLLHELQYESNADFNYQHAKLNAAYNDIESLGSENYPVMFFIRSQAANVKWNYWISHSKLDQGQSVRYDKYWREEYDKAKKNASSSRELLLNIYNFYKNGGVTIPESNKFLIDNGLAKEPNHSSK